MDSRFRGNDEGYVDSHVRSDEGGYMDSAFAGMTTGNMDSRFRGNDESAGMTSRRDDDPVCRLTVIF